MYGKFYSICKWKKGEDEVVIFSYLVVYKVDNFLILIIKDVIRKDSGYYSFIVENSFGIDI